jgi:hypothetical protein
MGRGNQAAEKLLPLVYNELRRLAAAKIASTGSESTWSDVEGESPLREFSNGKNEAC